MCSDSCEVLVAAAGQIDHHQVILGLLRRQLQHFGDRVRRFQRRNDAFDGVSDVNTGVVPNEQRASCMHQRSRSFETSIHMCAKPEGPDRLIGVSAAARHPPTTA